MPLQIPNLFQKREKSSAIPTDPNIITRESFKRHCIMNHGLDPDIKDGLPKFNILNYEKQVLKNKPLRTRSFLNTAKDVLRKQKENKLIDWSHMRTSSMCENEVPYEQAVKVPLRKPLEWNGVHDIERVRIVLQRTVEQWDSCSTKKDLVKMVRESAVKMPRVKNIICFGLGSFAHRYGDCHCKSGEVEVNMITQHLTALTIAETLEEYCINQTTVGQVQDPIPIILQDPGYVDIDRTLLSELSPRFETRDDPDGFLAIDENSFVITIACVAPVYEVLADLTAAGDCGRGPAGILGDEVNTTRSAKWATGMDWETPRMLKFLKNYDTRGFDGFVVAKEEFGGLWKNDMWLWDTQLWVRKN
ncbi:hypothetical protein P280DRAFT_529141 [Massarina eburnea CBS 473.64]|uniref:SRR1-like domain-containing protein n=1 Tax=Massarina eburnea CBS 473.64 TaxID=1395130 RepID=A0A6A6RWE3_9PLEO|nr:hypothetical protein P280DRAFT_529141 [Massarina eburnea CBS 473.64]